MLGKCRRVENNQVVFVFGGIQKLERILAECLMTLVAGEIQFNVGVGQFDGFGTAVHRVYQPGLAPHGIKRETSGVAEHVEHALVFGIMLQQTAVFTLVNKEARLLSFQPIHMKFQSVFHGDVIVASPIDETVLLTQFSLEGQCGLALVEHIFNAVAHHAHQLSGNGFTAAVHTHAVGLHHGGFAIAVDHQSGQVVALAMHQSERVVVGIVGNEDILAHV